MLKELLKYHKPYHTEFQIENFIIKKSGLTLYGMWKQTLRELYKRTRGLREQYCDYEKLEIEIEQLEYQIKKEKDKYEKRLKEVELKRKIMYKEEALRVLKDTEREFKKFYSLAVHLEKKLKEKHGELTDEVLDKLDEEYWIERAKEYIALDVRTTGRISKPTLELIASLPIEVKKEILKEPPQRLAEKYLQQERYDVGEVPLLDFNKEEILKLTE